MHGTDPSTCDPADHAAPADPAPADNSTGLPTPTGLSAARITRLVAALTRRGLTVATAESLTAGLLSAVLTEIPGSSAVLRGGLVVYATELKTALAGVDADLLAAGGAVQAEVAAQLATGTRKRCGADIGVGLTGVAGPDPQDGVPAGTWFVALADSSGVHGRHQRPTERLTRAQVRGAAVTAAIELLEAAAER